MKIQGYAAREAGGVLEPIEYEAPEMGETDVLVGISHCGLCHTDVHFIDNDFTWTPYPFQRNSCGHCEWCVRGEENLCPDLMPNATFFPYGGFASAIVVNSRFAFRLPDGLNSEQAGPLMCGGVTVYSPLRRHCVGPSTRVGVVGIGGLGHLALQFARGFEAEVTAISSTPSKEREAREFGAHHFLTSSDEEAMEKAAMSLDLVLSTVHVPMPWMTLLGMLRKGGIFCMVGVHTGDVSFNPTPMIKNELSICGSMIGGRDMMREMLELAARDSVRPEVEVLPMDDVNRAIAKLREGRARYRMVLSRIDG